VPSQRRAECSDPFGISTCAPIHEIGGLQHTHWEHRTTNAFMEGLMNVFSATKRKARGYRFVDNLIAVLYFVAGRLRIPAH
jgi:transposase